MASQVQYRRGTNAQNAAFTGALAEITVDTTNGTLRVHDAITVGGSNIATVAYVTSQISALSSNSISSGTSNVRVFANGNVTTSAAGTANVLNVTSTGAIITGDLSVTGNATLSGNILGDRIQNGTTIIDIQTANGNANISVAGTSNVAVFASTGAFITGINSVSGNITGGNILTAGLISATGNITGGNILGGANVNATTHTGTTVSVTANITGGNILTAGLISATGAITGAAITGTGLTVSTGNITGGNLLLSGAIIDSAQLDIQTSAANANIALAPNGTGLVTVSTQVSAVGNILTGGFISATGNLRGANLLTGGSISAGGNITISGLISATGAITGAALTGSSLTVSTGNITGGNIVNGNGNGVGNIGSSTTYFNTVFAKATSAQYADLAEIYVSDNNYAPGTVVEFGGTHEITISSTSHSTAVAGIISTNPSYLMNSAQTGEHVLPVALTGRVPCRVQGPVRKGDVLVASSTPGVAQRIGMNWQPGCILGKSMEGIDNSEIQTIEVAVGRT
jgi:hypothetical protein